MIHLKDEMNWRFDKDQRRIDFMLDEDIRMVNRYIDTLNYNRGAMEKHYTEWSDIEDQYTNNIEETSKMPNSKMNRVVSIIEGMVSQAVDNNIAITTKGQGPEDESFAEDARIGLNWALRQNKIKQKLSLHERRRFKFGGAWIKVVHDKNFAGGFGLAKIQVPSLSKVWVDRKIKDFFRLDEADYIAESIRCSKSYAVQVYGYDKAMAIDYGPNNMFDSSVFAESFDLPDDDSSWVLIQYWSRPDGVLRLQEFSGCGILLYDSFRGKNRKENQKDKEEIPRSYYKHIYDQYPYFYTPKYTIEGDFYGFGDGRLLVSLQRMINELYDKIRIQMRPNLVLIDAYSEVSIEGYDDNSYDPVYFDGAKTQGRQPVYHIPWGQVGAEMFQLLEQVNIDVQRAVRFSDLMIGQAKSADTATEAAIQQQQGNAHSTHEKGVLESTLSEVAKYMLGLMIEFNEGGMSLRINEDEDKEAENEYAWVDFNQMSEVPQQMPATKSYKDEYTKRHPDQEAPKYEIVEGPGGKAITKSVCLDIEISVGSALPKNPAFLWSMIEKLSQMLVVDTDEQQPIAKPAISWKELREFMVIYLGIPIKSEDQMKAFVEKYKEIQMQEMAQAQAQRGSVQGGPNAGAAVGQAAQGQMPSPMNAGMTETGNVMQPEQKPAGPMGPGEGPM